MPAPTPDPDVVDLDPPTDDVVDLTAISALTRGEVGMQIEAARRFPRSIKRFMSNALHMCTLDGETAASCYYSIPRDGKMIEGPSVRLAEIAASAWGNMRIEGRALEPDERYAHARGTAWDIERNVLMAVETERRITTKKGKRFSDDMIIVTSNAAVSIALRNAIFRVIPTVYVRHLQAKCREVAVGTAETLVARRDRAFEFFSKLGVSVEQMCARLDVAGVEDVTLDHLATLQGLRTAIRDGDTSIDDAFPPAEDSAMPRRRASDAPAGGDETTSPGNEPATPGASEPGLSDPAEKSQGNATPPADAGPDVGAAFQDTETEPAQPVIPAADRRAILAACERSGKSVADLSEWLTAEHGIVNTKSIPVNKLDVVRTWAETKKPEGESK